MLVHHKWFIRAGLAMFWAAEVIAWAFDLGFITYLLTDHTWIMLFIIFLSFKYMLEPFYAPFIKFTTSGGETMEKSNKLMWIGIAILGTIIVAMAIPESRDFLLNLLQQGVLNPIYNIGVSFNTFLGTYPALWILGSGVLGGLLLAIFLNTFVRDRLTNRVSSTTTPRSLNVQTAPAEPEPAPRKTVPPKSVATPTEPVEEVVQTETAK